MSSKRIYYHGEEGCKLLLGAKAAGLAEMAGMGMPVPAYFTLTTEVCRDYLNRACSKDDVKLLVREGVASLEERTGKKLGGAEKPLIVSVRSGAAESMPGMMSTVINAGMNEETTTALAREPGSRAFALRTYENFLISYWKAVHGGGEEDGLVELHTDSRGLKERIEHARNIALWYMGMNLEECDNPEEQIVRAVLAVFKSWNSKSAKEYRAIHGISDKLHTGATVQAMVFGNLGKASGTGIACSRDDEGNPALTGNWLAKAQGIDVVSGNSHPKPLSEMRRRFPQQHKELCAYARQLESQRRAPQNIEFTIEERMLYMLQTRKEEQEPMAALKTAIRMAEEKVITRREALQMIPGESMKPGIALDTSTRHEVLAKGKPAVRGIAAGRAAFDEKELIKYTKNGAAIFVVGHLEPEDITPVKKAAGIITAAGGTKSHPAVVAMGMNKPYITECPNLEIDYEDGVASIGSKEIKEGEAIAICGATVLRGQPGTIETAISSEAKKAARWASRAERRIAISAGTAAELKRIARYALPTKGARVIYRTEPGILLENIGLAREIVAASRMPWASYRMLVRALAAEYRQAAEEREGLEFMLMQTKPEDLFISRRMREALKALDRKSRKGMQCRREMEAQERQMKEARRHPERIKRIHKAQREAISRAAKAGMPRIHKECEGIALVHHKEYYPALIEALRAAE